jgi:hypothetical protein
MIASEITIGQRILVSYTNPNSKDKFERMTVKMDPQGFAVTVTNFRAKALVGKGVLVQVDKGVFGRVLADTEVYLAN